jgi:hypothetical protein
LVKPDKPYENVFQKTPPGGIKNSAADYLFSSAAKLHFERQIRRQSLPQPLFSRASRAEMLADSIGCLQAIQSSLGHASSISSILQAFIKSALISSVFAVTALLRATITTRKPHFSLYSLFTSRHPSRSIRLTRLLTTAAPIFLVTVIPSRLILCFSGLAFLKTDAFLSANT